MTPQLAFPAELVSQSNATSAPTQAQAKQFEAALDRSPAQYVAPATHQTDAIASNPWVKQASEASEKMRLSIEKPMEIPEGASDMERLTAVYARTEATALAIVQLDYSTKATELGTKNMQTLYQMQG